MTAHPRPRSAASSKLLDPPVDRSLIDPLAPHVDWVPMSPEIDDIDGCVFDSDPLPLTERLPAEQHARLSDPTAREHFIEGLFAHARLRELFTGDWRARDLVTFHSRHKLQILAHDPAAYRTLGRIVADAGTRPRDDLERDYRRHFNEAIAVRPSRGRHTNALLHVLGPLTARLDPSQRNEIVAAIDLYHQDQAPLSGPMNLLRHHAEATGHTYLAQQTYLDPYPAELRDL